MNSRLFSIKNSLAVLMVLAIFGSSWQASALTLAIQPILSEEKTRAAFHPLAEYLAKALGEPVEIVTSRNFLSVWLDLKRGKKYSMVIFGAHLTDVMHKNWHYDVLAKIEGTVSMSLVTSEDNLILDPEELLGKTIATMAMPSSPAIILSEIYPDPFKVPENIVVNSSEAAVKKVLSGEADSAIIPTPMVGAYEGLSVVMTTEPLPHIALSVSSDMAPATRAKLRKALLEASQTTEGQAMLEAVGIGNFEPADASIYSGYGEDLAAIWIHM